MSFVRNLTMQRLAAAALFVLVFMMAVRVPLDTDTWWHIRSGEYIVETRQIPRTDPFSHTQFGEDWIDHSWGAQIVLYGAYELFGGSTAPGDPGGIGLALYTALLATVGMVFVYRMCDGTVYLRAFAVVLGASAAAIFWSPRPQMFSFALAGLVLYLLHLYKRERIDRLWLIPLIMAAWSNLHGGFAIGFILLFGSLVGEAFGNLLDPHGPDVVRWARLRRLLLVTAISIPAIMLNPYGVRMLAYPFETVGIGVLQDYIQEWAAPNFHLREFWPFAALLLGTMAVLGLSTRRIDWADLALLAGTGMMALLAGRNIPVFALVAAPVLTRHLDPWLTERGWQVRPVRRVRGRQLALNWLLLLLIVIGALAQIAVTLNRDAMRRAQAAALPVEAASFLAEAPPRRMFNAYNWGGYLMFAAPDVPVYVDGRTDLYDDAFLRDYLRIMTVQDGWEDKLAAHDIDTLVIEANSALAALLRERPETWTERRFDDGRVAIFEKAG